MLWDYKNDFETIECISYLDFNFRPDFDYLSSVVDLCRCEDGKISVGIFLEVIIGFTSYMKMKNSP